MKRSASTRVDRRTTIKWLAATMLAGGCSRSDRFVGEEIPPAADEALLGVARAASGGGYGGDPDLLQPHVPWPRTMTGMQLETTASLADVILPADARSPAASELGVHEFVDEWVSAPYPRQRADRETILDGLEWIEYQCRAQHGAPFVASSNAQQIAIVDAIADSDRVAQEHQRYAAFFDLFRYLVVGAYYTTDAGMEDIGYIGNMPIDGPYPGPDEAALEHLASVLNSLGLRLPMPPT